MPKIRRSRVLSGPLDHRLEYVLQMLDIPEGYKVLEVGGAESPLSMILFENGVDVTCNDYRDWSPVSYHGDTPPDTYSPPFKFLKGDFITMDIPESSYDMLIMLSTVGYYKEPRDPDGDRKAIEKAWKVLKNGGILVLTVPVGVRTVTDHWRRYDRGWLFERLIGKFRVRALKFFTGYDINPNMVFEIDMDMAWKNDRPNGALAYIELVKDTVYAGSLIRTGEPILVNIGSGPDVLPQPWLNIDIEAERFKKPNHSVIQHDVRKGLPFRENEIDYIFSSHFVEHLTVHEAFSFLSECYKKLRPGGCIRLVLPDTRLMCQKYLEGRMMDLADAQPAEFANARTQGIKFAMIFFGAGASDAGTYRGHKSCYDFDAIKEALEQAGFRNIRQCEFNKSNISWLSGHDMHPGISFSVEAEK